MEQVFISHSSKDIPIIIQPIVDHLQNRGHKVWYGLERIHGGDKIISSLSEAIRQSSIFLLVISDHYNESPWCMWEYEAIASKCIRSGRPVVIIQICGATVPDILAHIHHLNLDVISPEHIEALCLQIEIAIEHSSIRSSPVETSGLDFVKMLMDANDQMDFGRDLLLDQVPNSRGLSKGEGLILIKPGGTFTEAGLTEILDRLSSRCAIYQLRLFDGPTVASRGLFDKQYYSSVGIAKGEIPLKQEDYIQIRSIYDREEFEQIHGVVYSDNLVTPALRLCDEEGLSPALIHERWEKGRSKDLFWKKRVDGLNKIGYQKTVFPIRFDELPANKIRLVLNGFIPGYRKLFHEPESRIIAIHVACDGQWSEIRDKVVGGKSNPLACPKGSIRRDAVDGKIPLDPNDSIVNGQRNVCHASGTLLDGMYELIWWFEYRPQETALGKILEIGTSREPGLRNVR